MELLILAVVLGLIPAAIAQSKGRNFFAWWIYGSALFIVSLPHALMMKTDIQAIKTSKLQSGDSRKCPFCAEIIKREAVVCRYCGRDGAALTAAATTATESPDSFPAFRGGGPAARATLEAGHCPKCGSALQDVNGKDYCPQCVVYWR